MRGGDPAVCSHRVELFTAPRALTGWSSEWDQPVRAWVPDHFWWIFGSGVYVLVSLRAKMSTNTVLGQEIWPVRTGNFSWGGSDRASTTEL